MTEELKTIDTVDTSPFKKMVMTIGELPSSFVESMTYYECLAWLVNYLQNTVIQAVNNNAEVSEELQAKFIELKGYVDNYFDNLDVQEEINNKLDEMAESGQLADIVAQYLSVASVLAYNTVADMKNADNLVTGSVCQTLGYRTLNDGGQARYKIKTITNTDVVDEMYKIALDDPSLIAELIVGDTIAPETLGAYGDGTHDDTTYIQNLFNADAKILFGKGKTYKTTASIIVPSDTYLDLNNSTISYIIGTGTNQKVFSSIDTNNVVICNGVIRTDYADKLTVNSQVIGIYLGGTKNCEVFNMDIGNCGGPVFPSGTAGLYLDISDNNDSDKNYVHDCVFGGEYDSFNVRIFSPFYEAANKEAKNNVIARCKFAYAHKSCIEIAGLTTHDNLVTDCEVLDCGTEAMDIDKTSYNNTIKNVVVRNCSGSDEDPDHIPFGGISIQHRDADDAPAGYYSYNNTVENCIIEHTVGCGFYSNTQDFKFINCICKSGLYGMIISHAQYPTDRLPKGEIIGCELHGDSDHAGLIFNYAGNVKVQNCKLYGKYGIDLTSQASASTNVTVRIENSEIHHANRGIWCAIKNIEVMNCDFYDDMTPFSSSSASGILGSGMLKGLIENNHFHHTTARDIDITCGATATPTVLLAVTGNYVSSSTASAKINIKGDHLNVGNFIGNSILPNINASLTIDKTYD